MEWAKLLCLRISEPTKVGEISGAVLVLLLNIMIRTVTMRDSDNDTFVMLMLKLTSFFTFSISFSIYHKVRNSYLTKCTYSNFFS